MAITKYLMNVNWRMAYDTHAMRSGRIILTNSMQYGLFIYIFFTRDSNVQTVRL